MGLTLSSKLRLWRLAKAALFCTGLLLFNFGAEHVLKPLPSETVPWASLKFTEGELDVIALGSSHTHCAILPMEMWREAGITAANVTGPAQPLAATVAFLEESLTTQCPKVVLLEACMIERPEPLDYRGKANLDPMPWGIPKASGILRSYPVGQWAHLFLPVDSYHDRWDELTRGDFNPRKYSAMSYMRGALYLHDVGQASQSARTFVISEQSYIRDISYVKEIADICKAHGIQLIVFNAPPAVPVLESGKPLLERISSDLREDHPSVKYLDMNDYLTEMGLDLGRDCKNQSHLNGSGGAKASRWLAAELRRSYGVRDRSDGPIAGDWDSDLILWDHHIDEGCAE